MKICEILASQGEGGLEKHMLDLCNQLAEMGQEVHVIVDPYFAERFAPGVVVHCLNMKRSRNNPFLLWQLYSIICSIAPDVIHAQANKAVSLLARLKRFLSAPCVGTIHNQKSKSAMFRKMDGVIGVSQGACSVVDHEHKRCVYNGVSHGLGADHKEKCRQQLLEMAGSDGKRPLAVALVRLVEVKRIDVLLQAWQQVPADLLILGDGPLRGTLEQQAKELEVLDRVHFAGFVRDAASLLPGADVMVISSDREGFPYAMVEALRAKVPVISTQVAAAKEALPLSLQSPLGDAAALAEKVQDFFAAAESYEQDLKNLFDWTDSHLSLEAMCQETLLFLQQTQDRVHAACSQTAATESNTKDGMQ